MEILKFLDVIKTYENYLIRCRIPNYASWPNFAWKYQLLVAVLLLCQNDLKHKNWHFWWVRGHENSQISWCHKNLPKLSYSMQNAKLCIMAEFGVKISIISAFFATLSKWPKTVKNWHFWWVRGHENSQISWCHKNLPKLSYSMQNAKLCIMAEFRMKISIISASFATLSKWPKTVKNWHFWWVQGHENSQISWCHKNLPKLSYSMQNTKLCIMAEFRMKISIISGCFATLSKWPKTV